MAISGNCNLTIVQQQQQKNKSMDFDHVQFLYSPFILFLFLGAEALLDIAQVKNIYSKNEITKKLRIAITCTLLLLLTP